MVLSGLVGAVSFGLGAAVAHALTAADELNGGGARIPRSASSGGNCRCHYPAAANPSAAISSARSIPPVPLSSSKPPEPPSPAPEPLPATFKPPPSILSAVPVHWGLTDVINCVSREVQKREATYPSLVSQGRLSIDRAKQEIGQMKAALHILIEMRDKGQDARQRNLFG